MRARAALFELLAATLATLFAGCAGHEARVETALAALDKGSPEQAVSELNAELEVERAEDLPVDLEGDNALLVLDRATVLQSLDDYRLSARDYGAADKAIDVLDLSANAGDSLGKYLFSDDVGRYRAPAFEKLLINTFNMMNYLALRDVSGAKVEARRLAVVQRSLKEQGSDTTMLGLGSYLAGFAFEKAGQNAEALAYYDDALRYATYATLRDPLRVLTQGQPRSPTIDALVGGAGPLASVVEQGLAELVVVVGYGRIPQKEPVRIPIGLALTLVAASMSPQDSALAGELAAKGLVTWVNFPRLGKGKGRYAIPQLWVDGAAQPLEHALDVESEVRQEWERNEGTVIAAAITRLITRAVAGEVTQRATAAASDSGILGLFAGLATTATLSAVDTPDTRSWTTLPSQVAVGRLRLPPGRHTVQVSARGHAKTYRVDLRPSDWAFVCMTALR